MPRESLYARLVMEHEDIDGFLDRLVAVVRANDRPLVTTAVADLEARLTAHFALEEALLFPAFASVDPGEAEDLSGEHRAIRERLAALGTDVRLQPVRLSRVEHLAQLVRRHAVRENALLYRWADRELSVPARRVVLEECSRPDATATGV